MSRTLPRIPVRSPHVCPTCGVALRGPVPTAYGERYECDCPDIRWTYVRGDADIYAERR